MKNLLFTLLFFICISLNAQDLYPKKIIDDFFVAFHAKDTITLKELCHPEIIMQTIANTKEGNKIETNEFSADILKDTKGELSFRFKRPF